MLFSVRHILMNTSGLLLMDANGYVKEVEHWGSDAKVIEAARMSTNKGFLGWDHDQRLLSYLWTHQHHTPFEMAGLVVEVQTPIFVAREWFRHRTQSFNELSGRYAELPNLYYIPSVERLMAGKQSQSNKQGSEEGFTEEQAIEYQQLIENATKYSRQIYEQLLKLGVSRELARLVIPVNQYTRFRASANLRNWLVFLALRLDKSAQLEIREYAQEVAQLIKHHFPRTYDLFDRQLEESRNPPASPALAGSNPTGGI
jgi:thymidylate synthase (FAD)